MAEKKDWLDGYDPVAEGEQDEYGNDLIGLRYNLELNPDQRWDQYVRFARSVSLLIDAARTSGFTHAGRGLGL